MSLFSFQGIAYLAERDANGRPKALRDPMNVPTLQVALSTTVKEHQESRSGQRVEDERLQTAKKAEVTMDLEDFSIDNLVEGLYGVKTSVAAGTFSAETFPADLVAGNFVLLDNPNVSDLQVSDSAGTPAQLTPGTDYELTSAPGGIVKILNPGTYTQPFTADGSFADRDTLAMFASPAPERFIVFDGINTIDESTVRVELYRVRFDPISQLDLINADYGKLSMKGSVLWDYNQANDPSLGRFGRIMTPKAP